MLRYCILFLVLVTYSCKVEERPIVYGSDECEYCKMLIIDQRYGSELVTGKGKIITFDAAECLIEYIYHNEDIAKSAHSLLVTNFTNPGHLIDAKTASYLVSQQMPSPMGAYLTAFSDSETAKEFQSARGGYLYSWEELIRDFRSIRVKAIEEFE